MTSSQLLSQPSRLAMRMLQMMPNRMEFNATKSSESRQRMDGRESLRAKSLFSTIYVVNYERDECLPIVEEARKTLFGDHKPADVVLGVASLSPGHLIEVDAITVVG
ncbi:RidA family protein [Rhodanobacter sp. DHG33]|uniref:RidA family protein n=1 Tax=Rhodanobacter sp. DHG33 TaxID=2775921 RepID=UPI001CE0A845|nr:RidA family protein [Rhodanobacter sp. DHG33]